MIPALAPLLFYLVAAIVFTWPLAIHPTTVLAATAGPGDPYLNLWALGWDLRTIAERPLAIVTGDVFNANIFHPARQTLAYSDHLVLQALAVWPVYYVTGDFTLCYNLVFFMSLVAAGLAMHAFVRVVVGSEAGAYSAGLVWAFWPYHFAHLIHLQLQALYLLPLTFLFLHRLLAGRRRRDAILLGATSGLQVASSIYYGVIGGVGLAIGLLVSAFIVGVRRGRVLIGRLLLAGVVAVLLSGPFVWPYWQVQQREGFGRNLFEAARHSATAASYLSAPPTNLIYGSSGLLGDSDGPEVELFPGFVVTVLALFGFWRAIKSESKPVGVSMAAVALAGLVLSLGPERIGPIYSAAHRLVFGFQAIRAPARFAVLVAFGLATLAAIAIRELHRARPARPTLSAAISVAALGLIGLEYANRPIPFVSAPPQSTEVGRWLSAAPSGGAIVYLPLGLDLENTPFMVESLEHGRPIVNGYSGQRPAFYAAVADTLASFPSAESLWTLHELGVQYVVSPDEVIVGELPLVQRARLARGVSGAPPSFIYELTWTPEAETDLSIPDEISPPDPGPATFSIGESARYSVAWLGGGTTVPAGFATMSVEAPDQAIQSAAYRFVVKAQTAPWVSRFFEADDLLASTVDQTLLPIVYEEHLREGRRVVDRVAAYDRARRLVRVANATAPDEATMASAVGLRIPAKARDPLAAFFYVRTLPLEQHEEWQIPIESLGRNMVLRIAEGTTENIERQGQRVRALKQQPQIVERIPRRQPPDVTVWTSLDGRRLPLRIDVAAGFGRFRLELVEYKGQ